jgi:hypothetical protein
LWQRAGDRRLVATTIALLKEDPWPLSPLEFSLADEATRRVRLITFVAGGDLPPL